MNEEVRSSGMLSLDKDTKLLTNMNKYKVPLRTLKNVFLCAIPVEHRKIPFSPLFAFASLCSGRVSRCFSRISRGSMTLEAAVILPFYMFTVLSLISFIEIIQLQNDMTMALREVGTSMGVYGYTHTSVEEFVGNDFMRLMIKPSGATSVNYVNSSVMNSGDTIDLIATYSVEPRFNVISLPAIKLYSRYYGRAWTGYEVGGGSGNEETEQNVYVTDNGSVYHTSRYCTHLQLTISTCNVDEIKNKSNEDGNKYRACLVCGLNCEGGKYYITADGECYHSTINCPGLKRTVDVVPLSQVGGRLKCSRCGG